MLQSRILARGPAVTPLAAQRPLATPCRCSPVHTRQAFRSRVRCSSKSGDEPPGPRNSGFKNPFGGSKKQDEARRALQDMFKGKEDALKMYDPAPGGGGGSSGSGKGGSGGKGGGGGGGGGGESWRDFDPRGWGRRAGSSALSSLKSFGQAIAAVALFGVIILVVAQAPKVAGLALGIVRKVLRLGGSTRGHHAHHGHHGHHGHHAHHGHGHSHSHAHSHDADPDSLLGPWEQLVIAKYGPDAASRTSKVTAAAASP